ncbi:MAG TPA: tRNA (adenosine(37)-N6)-threonylcarbamoyltransferase complex dimerization subunit type 1 TsaB [Gammaproteobacteria bacterium]|nr:tRNA (adenosine(37)-N6)-threonylcarbamoyltransferase complex dimerization subunit type 1 TsaB [Gammaproteobacteria bacterium]
MKLLALDTSTEACSAALYLDGEVRGCFELAPRRHAALILPMLDSLLKEAGLAPAQLDALAFGRGPGAFTGVRIAVGVAQGVAFGAGLPVVPVSSLAALAHGIFRQQGRQRVLAALDARMGQVYWAAYEVQGMGQVILQGEERVVAPEAVPLPAGGGWCGAGTGWGAWGGSLHARLAGKVTAVHGACYPHAVDLAHLGASACRAGVILPPEQALPVYLRERVAEKTSRNKATW